MSAELDLNLHACVLAALILHDSGIAVTGDKMKAILEASNNTDVQLVYCNIVAKFLEGKDIPAMLTQLHSAPVEDVGDKNRHDGDWDFVSDAGRTDDGTTGCIIFDDSDSDGMRLDLFD